MRVNALQQDASLKTFKTKNMDFNFDNHPTGLQLISEERQYQVDELGFTDDHDDEHKNGELVDYAIFMLTGNPDYFPAGWDGDWADARLKHSTEENYTIAGALLAAELDRLSRAKAQNATI